LLPVVAKLPVFITLPVPPLIDIDAVPALNVAVTPAPVKLNGPVSSSGHLLNQNIIAGTLTLNLQSGSRGYTVQANNLNGNLTINDATVNAPTQGGAHQIVNNSIAGTITISNRASASITFANSTAGGFTITNDYDSMTNGTIARTFVVQSSLLQGAVGNNIYFSGSANGTGTTNDRGRGLYANFMGGNRISASVIGDGNKHIVASAVFGQGLNIYGTSPYDASNAAIAGGANAGSAFFGRWNAEDGNKANSAETVFVVGTGVSGSTGITRKTGFLIDSGSNAFIEGTLNVSGSTTMTGSLSIAPTFQVRFATGSNQQAGTAVLDGANPSTVTVSNSLVTANSIILLTKQTLTNAHSPAITSKGAGTFTITSTGNGDTDTVGWFIINNS